MRAGAASVNVQAYGAYKWNSEQETGYVNFEH